MKKRRRKISVRKLVIKPRMVNTPREYSAEPAPDLTRPIRFTFQFTPNQPIPDIAGLLNGLR